jgi:hypothetical protein
MMPINFLKNCSNAIRDNLGEIINRGLSLDGTSYLNFGKQTEEYLPTKPSKLWSNDSKPQLGLKQRWQKVYNMGGGLNSVNVTYNNDKVRVISNRFEEQLSTLPRLKNRTISSAPLTDTTIIQSVDDYKTNILKYLNDPERYPDKYVVTHDMLATIKKFTYTIFIVWEEPKFIFNVFEDCQNSKTKKVGTYTVPFIDPGDNYLVLAIDNIVWNFGYAPISIEYKRNQGFGKGLLPFIPKDATNQDIEILSPIKDYNPTLVPAVFMTNQLSQIVWTSDGRTFTGPENDGPLVRYRGSNLYDDYEYDNTQQTEWENDIDLDVDEFLKRVEKEKENQRKKYLLDKFENAVEKQRTILITHIVNTRNEKIASIQSLSSLTLDDGTTVDLTDSEKKYSFCLSDIECFRGPYINIINKNNNDSKFNFGQSYNDIKETPILIK